MARVGSTALGERALPRLTWGAVIAGVLVALASHVVLGLIGAAIGFVAQPADSNAVGAGAAIWGLLTPFVATLVGAWLACRMAGERDEAGSNLHGVLVWAIGLIAGALFLAGTLATGAMSAGTAASGNAGTVRQLTGASRADVQGPRADLAADEAGKKAAGVAGGAAMAALAGLLGAFAGAAIARRRHEGKGLGFRIAIHRDQAAQRREGEYRPVEASPSSRSFPERPYPGTGEYGSTDRPYGAGERVEETRDVTRPEPPAAPPPSSDPYHH